MFARPSWLRWAGRRAADSLCDASLPLFLATTRVGALQDVWEIVSSIRGMEGTCRFLVACTVSGRRGRAGEHAYTFLVPAREELEDHSQGSVLDRRNPST